MKTRSFNILLAEDDPSVCLVLGTILNRLGQKVEIANNGREAIEIFTLKPGFFEVVITDHRMPLASGLKLVEHLRNRRFEGKIIVVSGFLTNELETAYRANRIDKIIQKPFELKEIASVFEELFSRWKDVLPKKIN